MPSCVPCPSAFVLQLPLPGDSGSSDIRESQAQQESNEADDSEDNANGTTNRPSRISSGSTSSASQDRVTSTNTNIGGNGVTSDLQLLVEAINNDPLMEMNQRQRALLWHSRRELASHARADEVARARFPYVVPKLLKSVDSSALNADKLLESVWESRKLILQLVDQVTARTLLLTWALAKTLSKFPLQKASFFFFFFFFFFLAIV